MAIYMSASVDGSIILVMGFRYLKYLRVTRLTKFLIKYYCGECGKKITIVYSEWYSNVEC